MAPLLQDLRRLAQGVSIVALEAAKRSPTLEAARTGDVEAFVTRILKSSVVSATDLAGLTRGRPHAVDSSAGAGPSGITDTGDSPKESIVYFSDESETLSSSPSPKLPSPEEKPLPESESSAPMEVHVPDRVVVAATPERADNGSSRELDDHGRNKNEYKDAVLAGLPPEEDAIVVVGRSGGDVSVPTRRRRPRERRVPSTPFSRAIGFAGLGAGLAWGTIQESARRVVFGMPKTDGKQSASPFLSEQNAERLALALCRMRGAALKLGQMLSIQDESLVPAPILAALDIVRQGADVMPRNQLNDVLDTELGPDWRSKLRSFDYEPLAAASIGQVHRAVLKNGMDVAIKIQYPGVADSIESDIENVRRLLDYTNLIPKGLFLDRAIKVAKEELSRECDYVLEAANQKRFRELLSESEGFYVPLVIDEVSSKKVLTTELVAGVPIDKVALLMQETRDYVGKKLLELTLKELFVFRFMQTDPNWSNFLFDDTSRMINLIDFGAAREYPKGFVDDYLCMVIACANSDRDSVIEMSRRLGFLTGEESDVMLDAHVQAGFIVGLPFAKGGLYDFRATNITQSISDLGATMLRHRLTPPPDKVYSLHRKLSGAFLACMKLGAVVPCRELLLQIYQQHQFGDADDKQLLSNRA